MTNARLTDRSPSPAHGMSRRRALKTLFCSSAALALNIRSGWAAPPTTTGGVDVLLLGDFGTTGEFQKQVAQAMRGFVEKAKIQPAGLMLLGDNFYSAVKGGFTTDSERWRTGIEDMYPASHFPGPMWSILGNHDYHDNAGGEQVQLAYARKSGVRWHMPAKWYRFEIGQPQPLVTVIALDSNLPKVSGGKNSKTGLLKNSMTADEAATQLAWFQSELAKPRAPFTLVLGHHPLYSNGSHGDTRTLIEQWGGLLQEHKVHAYLCGHDHDLQHLELEDRFTSFVLSGGGGARTRALKSDRKMPFARDVYGFTHLQITSDGLTFSHHGVDGGLLHRFTKRTDGAVELA